MADEKFQKGDRKPFGGKASGNKLQNRSFGGKKPFEKREDNRFGGNKLKKTGEKRSFGGDEPGEKRDFRKPGGDRPFGKRPEGDRPFGKRPEGDRPAEKRDFRKFDGERPARPAGDRPFGKRPEGTRPAQGRPGTPRPANVRSVKKAEPEGLATRRMALEIIREVTENGAYASLCLNEKLTRSGLSAADRRLVARLAYDTLEHMLYLDYALNQLMAKPDTDIKLRNILRLGACQILIEDRIPESAATNTAVMLCRELGMEGLGGVCNGILRNLIRKKGELVWPDPEKEPIKARSIKYSVPEWLVNQLDNDWGEETANALMACHQQETVTVRPNMTRTDDAAFEKLLEKKVWGHEKATVPHAWHIRDMADIGQDADFQNGEFSIQSESSMMACMALDVKRGMQVLDTCAAPGGKSCLIAEMMNGTGRVQAWDKHEHRVALIAAQQKRLGLDNIRPMTRDALKLREDMIKTMDAVLLDAPCSGLGTMADKPDVKHRVQPENVAELVETQRALLETCCQYVKPGGVLVYSTCSVLRDENDKQIAAFLERHPEFKLDKLPESIPEQYRKHAETGLQLLPHRDGTEGFYIARMKRSRV